MKLCGGVTVHRTCGVVLKTGDDKLARGSWRWWASACNLRFTINDANAKTKAQDREVQADLTLRKIKTVTISGKVIGSDAQRHVMVSLTVPETGNEELTAQAEQDGSFRITNVPAGTYILSARNWDRDKSEQVRQKLGVGDQNIDSLVLAFRSRCSDHWPNPFNCKGVAQLEGTVTDGDKPIVAAQVRLTHEPATPLQ